MPQRSQHSGECSYCKSTDVHLVEPSELADYFEVLFGIYKEDDNGQSLYQWVSSDWGLFRESNLDEANANGLIADIFNDGELVRKKFSPASDVQSGSLSQWESLRAELLHSNRFFPDVEFDSGRLEELLVSLVMRDSEVADNWFRARIGKGDSFFKCANMGAPPKSISTAGRANPAGIPYLYLGSTLNGAISEVRPHSGDLVYAAEFQLNEREGIVDLRSPRNTISPFLLSDGTDLSVLRAGDLDFLDRLGKELTIPVLPAAAAIEYIPSQYLCEFIKKCGFRGVVYTSSTGEGHNLALFQPEDAACALVKEHRIVSVSVSTQPHQC